MDDKNELKQAVGKASDRLNVVLHALCNRALMDEADIKALDEILSEIKHDLDGVFDGN